MLKKLFVWVAGIYLCLSFTLFLWDQIKKNNETFKVLSIHREQTVVGKMYHIVASREDKQVMAFDRFSDHSMKAGDEFDVFAGIIRPAKKSSR